MSAISTSLYRHSLWPLSRHSAQGVAELRPVRLAHLNADLTNDINQQPPSHRTQEHIRAAV